MQYLSTGLYTLALIVALTCAWVTRRHADRADRAARKLEAARGRLVSLEAAVDSIDRSHRKLSGRFYAERQQRLEDVDVAHVQHNDEMTARQFGCENWRIAAIEGPRSEAASCECEYCVSMREARRQAKAQLVPKGQAARVDAIRKGQSQ